MDKGIEQKDFDCSTVDPKKMPKSELISLAKSTKHKLETMKKRDEDIQDKFKEFVKEGNNVSEIDEMIKECNWYKQIYEKEKERNNHHKIVLDSQSRILKTKQQQTQPIRS